MLAPSCGLRVIPVLAKREGSVRDGGIPAIRGAGGARLEPVSAENGTVVVVEDDPNIADLVDLYLRREGYRVLLAADGPCVVVTMGRILLALASAACTLSDTSMGASGL